MPQFLCCYAPRKKKHRKAKSAKIITPRSSINAETVPEVTSENKANLTPKPSIMTDVLTKDVMRYLSNYIGHEWELVGFNLGLQRGEIAKASSDNKENHKNKVFQMLMIWLEKNKDNRRRFSTFVRALETSGRKDLAQKMHCAKWSEQEFRTFDMPSTFPMLLRIDKVRPKKQTLAFPKINDLNPSTGPPVHSHSAKFIVVP